MPDERLPEGTKRSLLDLLLRDERTSEDLAASLHVSATAIRQHLATLTGLGMVERRKAATSGGRPAFLYRLSDLGRRSYPKRHDLLVRELIETLIARQGQDWTLAVVTDAAARLAEGVRDRLEGLDPGERWDAVLAWLEEEFAWEANAEDRPGSGPRLVLHQCPFHSVSSDHPAICGAFFTTLLDRLTGAGPFVHRPIADGVSCCALEIRGPAPATGSEETSARGLG
ncbi:MAG: helix-turn-helix transcriptional regulator [Gemmatimonadota bacterium]